MAGDWSEGYFTDLPYTYGYYREMCPQYLRFCLLLRGLWAPPISGFSYLELAMGNGYSANIHAASGTGKFLGMDFLPEHASFAQNMACTGHTGLIVSDESIEDFCSRDENMYDYICIHGGWTWIAAKNRDYITDFLLRRLKPGGIFFVSYNCWPGSSTNAPLRELFTLFNDYYQPPGVPPAERIRSSVSLAETFLQSGPLFLNSSSWFMERFASLKKEGISYLAHEFLNSNWKIFWFREVAKQLANAKLRYGASCRVCDNLSDFGLTPEASRFLNSVHNEIVRQQLWDFLCNTQFRGDIFCKGALPLNRQKRTEQLKAFPFVLIKPLASLEYALDSGMGRYTLDEKAHGSVAAILAANNYKPKTLDKIYEQMKDDMDFDELVAIITRLVAKNYAQPCQTIRDASVDERCGRLNKFILAEDREGERLKYLASPATGGGVEISAAERVFLAGEYGIIPVEDENYEKLRHLERDRISILQSLGVSPQRKNHKQA